METTDQNSVNSYSNGTSKCTPHEKLVDVLKSESNELDNEKCCSENISDIQKEEKIENTSISCDSYSEIKKLDTGTNVRKKLSEVHTYSTELTDDKENDNYRGINTPSSASSAECSNFSFQTCSSTTVSPIANLQRGSFGSVPRPPRPSASFCRLDVSTDLNLPPSNWLNVDPSCLPPGLAGFDATPHYSGFSSFRMASLFLDYSSRQR